jgi:hypothetical protein
MCLYASLGGPAEHERLAQLLPHKTHRRDALVALGYAGNTALLPGLLNVVRDGAPAERKLACQAIATITGLDPRAVELSREAKPSGDEPERDTSPSLPPLEEDDLDADLVPRPEDALPEPDAGAVEEHCTRAMRELPAGTRWLHGQRFGPESLRASLASAPLGRRHAIARMLYIRSGAAVWVDTRGFTRLQLAQTADAGTARLAHRGSGW